MTSWSDDRVPETGANTENSSVAQEVLVHPQTRRAVLSSLLGTTAVGALGTGAAGAGRLQDSGDEVVHHPLDEFDWMDWQRPETQVDPGPTNQHCPPTTLTADWESEDLGDGTTAIQLRPDSPDDEPVYAFGSDPTDPTAGGEIHALDRQTGSVIDGWPLSTDGFPVVRLGAGDRLFYTAGSADGSDWTVRSVDAETADEQWTETVSNQGGIVSLHYDEGRDELYTATTGPTVTAFDAENGNEVWSNSVGQGTPVQLASEDGDRLYVAGNAFSPDGVSGQMTAVDISPAGQGSEQWTESRDTIVSGTPAIGPDFLSIPFAAQNGDESEIVTLDADTGSEQWTEQRSDGLIYSGVPKYSDGFVYAAAVNNPDNSQSEGELVKFDEQDGSIEWTYDPDGMILGIRTDEDTAYVQTRPGDVIAIDDDPASSGYGTEKWVQTLVNDPSNGIRDGGFTLECDTLYTGTVENPGNVYAIDAESGDILDSFTVSSGVVRVAYSLNGSVWATSGRQFDQQDADAENRVYRLTGDQEETPDDTVTLSMEPDSVDVAADAETQVDMRVSDAESGIGEYTLTIGFDQSEVATISDVSLDKQPASGGVDIADDGSTATLDVDLGDDPYDQESVVVATVTVMGAADGETTLQYDSSSVVSSSGTTQQIESTAGCTVTVSGPEGPPPVIGDQQPSDPDGDGLYEDIDGDGEFTLSDVSQFFESYHSATVQENAGFFNFEGSEDGTVTLADVQALYAKYKDD
jgi:outer membrane protein assembly factor BamB